MQWGGKSEFYAKLNQNVPKMVTSRLITEKGELLPGWLLLPRVDSMTKPLIPQSTSKQFFVVEWALQLLNMLTNLLDHIVHY